MRKGMKTALKVTGFYSVLMAGLAVSAFLSPSSKGTESVARAVENAYRSEGVVAAFQTAGEEVGFAFMQAWADSKRDASRLWGVVQKTPEYAVVKQVGDAVAAGRDPIATAWAERIAALENAARSVFDIPSELEKNPCSSQSDHYIVDKSGNCLSVLEGKGHTFTVKKIVQLTPTPDEVKHRPRQATLEGNAL